MTTDSLRKDDLAAKVELAWLTDLTVGQRRTGPLFPGLPEDLIWTLVERRTKQWIFEGCWCGVPMMDIIIKEDDEFLTLTVMKEDTAYLVFPVKKDG